VPVRMKVLDLVEAIADRAGRSAGRCADGTADYAVYRAGWSITAFGSVRPVSRAVGVGG
jgi:hypothetical protein